MYPVFVYPRRRHEIVNYSAESATRCSAGAFGRHAEEHERCDRLHRPNIGHGTRTAVRYAWMHGAQGRLTSMPVQSAWPPLRMYTSFLQSSSHLVDDAAIPGGEHRTQA